MAIQAKKQSPWFLLLLISVSLAMWAIDQRKGNDSSAKPAPSRTEQPSANDTGSHRRSDGKAEHQGGYEVYHGCTLVSHKNNDGDSFMVRLPDGRESMMRLYYVDTPESAFKTYRGGADNHDRIGDQAAYFGVTPEQAVAIGQKGKHLTLDLLGHQPFTVFTKWDSPFQDQRYHAFIEVTVGGKRRWLHELLVEKGLVRMKTKPAALPDGTPVDRHLAELEKMQSAARKSRVGGWAAPAAAGAR